MNYYNDNDPQSVAWLKELIAAGLIPPGDVDERSITDVTGSDLKGYTQCHFFAGIAGWPYALSLAGWPVDRPVWTGSCPCQPFSCAGQRKGEKDERHLWPEFFRLIRECRPPVVFGEQVASAEVIGHKGKGSRIPDAIQKAQPRSRFGAPCAIPRIEKINGIRSNILPTTNTSSDRRRSVRIIGDTIQSGWGQDVGQPIDRQDRSKSRVCLSEHSDCSSCGKQRYGGLGRGENARNCLFDPQQAAASLEFALGVARDELDASIGAIWIARVFADLESVGYSVGSCDIPAAGIGAPHIRQRLYWVADNQSQRRDRGAGMQGEDRRAIVETSSNACGLEYPESDRRSIHHPSNFRQTDREVNSLTDASNMQLVRLADSDGKYGNGERFGPSAVCREQCKSPTIQRGENNFWSRGIWIPCTDGKARRIEPESFPLVDGVPGRMGLLRGYGNAIVSPLAAEFIAGYLEAVE